MIPQVLLVDDDPLVLEGLRRALRKEPYAIHCATSAEQALAMLATQHIDLIVSDERMPGMKGNQLLQVVREKYPSTMRIMLSGHPSLDVALRAINSGEVFRLFTKPCNEIELALGIRGALSHRTLLEQSQRLLRAARKQREAIQHLELACAEQIQRNEEGAILLSDESADILQILAEVEQELGIVEADTSTEKRTPLS